MRKSEKKDLTSLPVRCIIRVKIRKGDITMMNTLLTAYNKLTAATIYFIGFVLSGTVYGGYFTEIPAAALKLDHESSARGGAAKIRIRFNKELKLALKAQGKVKALATIEALAADPRYNKGDNFEKLIAELNGIQWAKNSDPFWVAGDLEINGEQVQVKFDGAELVNEKSLRKALTVAA